MPVKRVFIVTNNNQTKSKSLSKKAKVRRHVKDSGKAKTGKKEQYEKYPDVKQCVIKVRHNKYSL